MRILIADDDFTSRIVLSGVLKKNGHEVVQTVNGAEAWQAMQQPGAPALAIIDWMMPEMNGLEVVSHIRSLPTHQPPYIIMLTARGEKTDITAGLDAGADDYLTKPFDPSELRARVDVGLRLIDIQNNLLEAQHKINEALEAAGKIQDSLLPKHPPSGGQVQFAWKFKPCDAVGGDIFNIVSLDADHIGLYMLDVAGHGLPSAMISTLVYQLLNPHTGILVDHSTTPPHIIEPEAVLGILDREFPLMRFKHHFTIVYAVLDLSSGTLTYSNAAHCAPIIISREKDIQLLTTSGTVIGVKAIPFGQETVTLAPGDKVLLYSDGVIERENTAEEFFGEERLYQTLRDLRFSPPDVVVEELYTKVMGFGKNQLTSDDISILAFEYIEDRRK